MKLRFEKVRYAGLGKYKEETNHEFNEITKIIGENGTGKTTGLNSIVWALYEKNRMGETKNAKDIYNNESEETRVELELYIDKKRQVITRKRDKQDNKILKIHDKNVK